MSLDILMNPKPPTPPGAQVFDDVLKEQKAPLRSWRKKYRKMKHRFDKVMEQSNTLFTDFHKLEALSKRLHEENDQLLETLLHLNDTSRVPTYDLGDPNEDVVPIPGRHAVPDLESDAPKPLASLLQIPHTEPGVDADKYPEELTADSPPGYMSPAYEEDYLAHLDSHLNALPETLEDDWTPPHFPRLRGIPPEKDLNQNNPNSVLSWLRKYHPETFIQEKEAAGEKTTKAKGAAVGKRASMAAVTSAPVASTPLPRQEGEEVEEEWPYVEEQKTSARAKKSNKDKDDEPYRPKGGSSRAKRKRAEDGEKIVKSKRVKATPNTATPS